MNIVDFTDKVASCLLRTLQSCENLLFSDKQAQPTRTYGKWPWLKHISGLCDEYVYFWGGVFSESIVTVNAAVLANDNFSLIQPLAVLFT